MRQRERRARLESSIPTDDFLAGHSSSAAAERGVPLPGAVHAAPAEDGGGGADAEGAVPVHDRAAGRAAAELPRAAAGGAGPRAAALPVRVLQDGRPAEGDGEGPAVPHALRGAEEPPHLPGAPGAVPHPAQGPDPEHQPRAAGCPAPARARLRGHHGPRHSRGVPGLQAAAGPRGGGDGE